MFTDYKAVEEKRERQKEEEMKDKKLQNVMLDIKNKYGSNSEDLIVKVEINYIKYWKKKFIQIKKSFL